MKISIVSPVYKAREILPKLLEKIIFEVTKITDDFEIILVDDNCPQNSWEIIKKECITNSRVKGVKLSKNFGQHYAIFAGLEKVSGEWIIVMDCDLQDKPENIISFYEKTKEGYEIVIGRKKDRKDNLYRKIESWLFFNLYSFLTGIKLPSRSGNFGIYNRKVINQLLKMNESYKNFGVFVNWVGFNKIFIEIESDERYEGKSSYNFIKKWKLAVDTIISFSDKLLKVVIAFGLIIFIISSIFLFVHIIKIYINSQPLLGWVSLIISIFLSLGLILTCLGVIGLYIGKLYTEAKKRPNFITQELINLNEKI